MARLLVVDDDPGTLDWMEVALTDAGHEVRSASNAQRALAILDEWRPDLALLDILMPEIDGWAFSRIVRRHGIPVLFLSIVRGEAEAILRGCTGLLRKPLSPVKLRHEVQLALGARRRPATVLVVDDDPDARAALSSVLTPDFRTVEAENGVEALEILEREPVDLVITDVKMPLMGGRELVRRIRSDRRFGTLPVIVQTGDLEAARAPIWTELQVERVLTKDRFATWLLSRIDLHTAGRPNAAGPP
jgi:CheY-like chemotaxis protein